MARALDKTTIPPIARLPGEWADDVALLGGRPFHAKQIFRWIHARGVTDPARMTDLSAGLRAKLADIGLGSAPTIADERQASDGTRKLLVRLADGAQVETVLIPEARRSPTMGAPGAAGALPSPFASTDEADAAQEPPDLDRADDADAAALDDDGEDESARDATASPRRVTQCISTQVGCAMGCVFCASGVAGLTRNMGPDEIVAQVLLGRAALGRGEVLRGVVFMGMGEPLHNYEATTRALRLLLHPDGVALSSRRVTVSTSGLVPEIERLGEDFRGQIGLAVSLHAADEAKRSRLVPINRKYPLKELMAALRRYPLPSRRRITIEYTLIAGENDSDSDASLLARILEGLPVKVNLIPMNPVGSIPLRPPPLPRVLAFQKRLCERGLSCFIRRRRGSDVSAACGQLALLGAKRKVRGLS